MKTIVFERYLKEAQVVLFGERSEDSDSRIEFEIILAERLPECVPSRDGLHSFLIEGKCLGIANDVLGHALILENSIEIKALGLASSELAS